MKRAETVLVPSYDAWLSGGENDQSQVGTLDWLFNEYRDDRRFKKLDAKTKRNHEIGFALVGKYVLKNRRHFGQSPLSG